MADFGTSAPEPAPVAATAASAAATTTVPDASAATRPPRKRRRPAVVCAECRRRKIACDRKTPCGQCALHNVECVYVTGAVPPPYGRPVRSPSSPGAPGRHPKRARTGTADWTDRADTGRLDPADRADTKEPRDKESQDTSSLGDDVVDGDPAEMFASTLGERPSRDGGRLAKTRLFGRTHWVNNMDQFKVRTLTHLVHAVTHSAMYKNRVVCKRLARLIKADETRRVLQSGSGGGSSSSSSSSTDPPWLPPLEDGMGDRLLDLYFNAFEPVFRVLHMPTFRREYRQYLAYQAGSSTASAPSPLPLPPNDAFMVKLVLVLALGSCFLDEGPAGGVHDSLRVAARQAVRRLDVAHCTPLDKHELNMDMLQVYCLVLIARQTTALETGDDLTWFSVGGLLHTAFGMGLNRDPSHFKSMTPFQAEMRRRLWATILELVLQASLDQGMPPLISLDDYNCLPPANLNDEDMEEGGAVSVSVITSASAGAGAGASSSTAGRPLKGQPDAVFTHTSLQRLLCRSQPTRLKIVKALNGLGVGLSYERALQLSSDLQEACRYTATTLRTAPLMAGGTGAADAVDADAAGHADKAQTEKEHASHPPPPPGLARLRILFYEFLTRRFHHSLHSPFARKASANVQFFFSRRARIESALRLMSLLRRPGAAAAEGAEGSEATDARLRADPCWRLAIVGRGFVKCTLVDMDATVAIEMILQLQEDFVAGADLTLSQRELYETVQTIVRLKRLRVEAGETNIKGYVFFCGGLAQIDALLEGSFDRQRILDASQASSARMIAALRTLAARKHVALPEDVGGGEEVDDDDGDGDDTGQKNDDVDNDLVASATLTISPAALHPPDDDGTLHLVDPSLLGSSGGSASSLYETCGGPGGIGGIGNIGSVYGAYGAYDAAESASVTASVDADLDSGIHMSTVSSASGGLWNNDDWIVDPQGDFGYGNWFFPYNERVGLE